MEDIKKQNKKQFKCQDCGVTFYHIKGLNVHRKLHETKTVTAIVTAAEPIRVAESAVKIKTDVAIEMQTTASSSTLQELLAIYAQNTCKKKGRPVFISDNLFQQLHETSSTHLEWKDLEPDCVYKLISLSSRGDNVLVGKLENREGISFSIVLPNFVVAKLLSLDNRNSSFSLSTIYIKKPATSLDEISLVTVAKWTCKKCALTLNSKQTLYRHCKKYCIYSKQTKLGVDIGGTLEKMEQ